MDELVKSQTVRLWDVWVIGPVMVCAALRLPKQDRTLAWLLGAFGVGTVVYNARNYRRIAEKEVAAP